MNEEAVEWAGGEAYPLFGGSSASSDNEDPPISPAIPIAVMPASSIGITHVETIAHEYMSSDLFSREYRMKKPVVMKGMCSSWVATRLWSEPGALSNSLISSDGTTLVSKDNTNFLYHELCDISTISAKDAISIILDSPDMYGDSRLYTRLYIDTHPELLSHIDTDCISRISSRSGDVVDFVPKNMGVWVSSRGCITPLHYDLCHGFLCQVVGQKRFLLASPDETQYLYRNTSIATKNQTSSQVDLHKWLENDQEERKKYPNLGEVQLFCADLSPGDVLYTPPGWWHSVTSISKSVSVLLPFDMERGEHLSVLQSL